MTYLTGVVDCFETDEIRKHNAWD